MRSVLISDLRAALWSLSLGLPLLLPAISHADIETGQRIAWIQSRLDAASDHATYWQTGWTALYGVSTLAYAAQAESLDAPDERHDRVDARVATASSLLGFAGMFLDPLTTADNAKTLAKLPADTPPSQRQKLQNAERMLQQNAAQEKNARSLQAHILTAVVSVLSGAAVASDDHRHHDGAMVALQSLLVGEVQIYTAPTAATEAWQTYQQNGWRHASRDENAKGGWQFVGGPQAVAVNYRF